MASTADGLVYREYLDAHYTVPNKAKLIEADVNEPPWDRRIPGCLLYAKPGERLYIHVWNSDTSDCHSFHIHGLRYGIESDGAWPLGVAARDGRRSDEILPGQKWTYVYDVTPDMVGAWGFHDHSHDVARNINLGLFGGLIVRDAAALAQTMRFRYLFINLPAARALHFKASVSLMAICSVSFSLRQRLFTITVRFMAPQ